jgi:hypothetical protein
MTPVNRRGPEPRKLELAENRDHAERVHPTQSGYDLENFASAVEQAAKACGLTFYSFVARGNGEEIAYTRRFRKSDDT